jgi:NAD(P)-dependent dehydrogenase (short-subunit alcohol dehydrogenase family)
MNTKTIIVTGGSQGIGAGLVRAFLDRGYNVVANSRNITKSGACGLAFPSTSKGEIHWARRRGARCGSGAQGGSPRGAQRPRCRAAAFGIARQSDADRPARRVGGHFGRRTAALAGQ